MLKIPKGLKKKKKGKKGKHKGDDDLFTPEELEEYKRQKALREQQGQHEAEAAEDGSADAASASTSAAPEHGAEPAASEPATAAEDEDRLQALLGGVDSILNKTQKDLERIKSTSFFQRKPTPSELQSKKAEGPPARPTAPTATAVAAAAVSKKGKKRWVGFEGEDDGEDSEEEHPPHPAGPAAAAAAAFEPAADQHAAHEEEEEEESEEEDEGDDIFDTSYIDVITSGEVKLAYIPDSPTEQPDDGDDPFDTTYAAKVIGNDEDIKKRQKLERVSLGIAVDVLTGKAAPPSKPAPLPENAVAKPRPVPRRVKPVDLLKLGSFDEGSAPATEGEPAEGDEAKADGPKSLLDDDALLAIPEDLPPVGTPIIPPAAVVPAAPVQEAKPEEEKKEEKQIDLSEFDVIAEKPVVALPVSNLVLVAAALGGPPAPQPEEEDEELEDEFAALAQESIQKKKEDEDEFAVDGDDPFDTSAAAVLLGQPDEPAPPAQPAPDLDVLLAGPQASWSAFDDDEHEQPHLKPSRPPPPRPAPPQHAAPAHDIDPFDTSIAHNILPGKTELKLIEKEILSDHNEARILSNSDSDFDFNPREGEEPRPQVSFYVTDPAGEIDHSPVVHRDLLGGSTSDLSQLGHDPIPADAAKPDEEPALPDDPFDTSAAEAVAAPGKTELRYLEKEILGDVSASPAVTVAADDDDFDPRAEDARNKATRPDVLPGVGKSVAFALPSPPAQDLLAGGADAGAKFSKPLTPYYADQAPAIAAEVDPFDTSIASNLAPGKAELKILESELVDGSAGIKASLSDDEFDPRGSQAAGRAAAHPDQDLFKVEDGDNVGHRPLTPAVEAEAEVDPFDTSIASNIAPGKAELKVLENELINDDPQPSLKRTYTDPDFNPRDAPAQSAQDLLNEPAEAVHGAKPLTPVLGAQASLDNADDIDPFDTSIAADIGPGKTELRILESELIGRQ